MTVSCVCVQYEFANSHSAVCECIFCENDTCLTSFFKCVIPFIWLLTPWNAHVRSLSMSWYSHFAKRHHVIRALNGVSLRYRQKSRVKTPPTIMPILEGESTTENRTIESNSNEFMAAIRPSQQDRRLSSGFCCWFCRRDIRSLLFAHFHL